MRSLLVQRRCGLGRLRNCALNPLPPALEQIGALNTGQRDQLDGYLRAYNLSARVVLHEEAVHTAAAPVVVNNKGVSLCVSPCLSKPSAPHSIGMPGHPWPPWDTRACVAAPCDATRVYPRPIPTTPPRNTGWTPTWQTSPPCWWRLMPTRWRSCERGSRASSARGRPGGRTGRGRRSRLRTQGRTWRCR